MIVDSEWRTAMVTASAAANRRAIAKAQVRGGLKIVRELGGGVYAVSGSMGTEYRVQDGAELVCTCPAGQAAMPCYHSAAVWLRRVAQRANATPHTPTRETAAQVRERLREESRVNVARWNDADLDDAPSLYAAAV